MDDNTKRVKRKRREEHEELSCNNYSLVNQPINNNFYFVNAHGEELGTRLEIPKGVRVIMFCHTKTLQVCPLFDAFNWKHILLDPYASDNYCNFLSTLVKYSSIRDHFCIYEEHDVIRNLRILPDDNFRAGVFRLPVKGYAFDEDSGQILVSDGTLLGEIKNDKKLMGMMKKKGKSHVKVDGKRVANLLRVQSDVGIIKSEVKSIKSTTTLSNIIGTMKMHLDEFTILLMVCRDRAGYDLTEDSNVPDESGSRTVAKEHDRMRKHLNLEKWRDGGE